MKKTFIILFSTIATCASAQVAIGKPAVTNTSVSLEFGAENRGLLLPWVTSAAEVTGAVDGTFIFDLSDKKVKYHSNGSWFNLTNANTDPLDTSIQDSIPEKSDARVAIGKDSRTDATPGILVLTDKDKAMILPKVAVPHLNIVNPSAGMIVYDTVNRQLAVFNGKEWSFWKP